MHLFLILLFQLKKKKNLHGCESKSLFFKLKTYFHQKGQNHFDCLIECEKCVFIENMLHRHKLPREKKKLYMYQHNLPIAIHLIFFF